MRILLPVLLGLFLLLLSLGCNSGKNISANEECDKEPGYKIEIQLYKYGITIGTIMDVISHNNIFITQTEEIPLANEMYELRIKVNNARRRELNNAECELRQTMNVFSVTIIKR